MRWKAYVHILCLVSYIRIYKKTVENLRNIVATNNESDNTFERKNVEFWRGLEDVWRRFVIASSDKESSRR